METPLGRFSLSTDGTHIYRLGGIDFNICSGGHYGRRFSRLSLGDGKWVTLPSVPFGTGGALSEFCPPKQSVIAVAGIETLGDGFDTNALTIGIYGMDAGGWKTTRMECPGLGRPAALVYWQKTSHILLTTDNGLDQGMNVALLDPFANHVEILAALPTNTRIVGALMLDGQLYVLESGEAPLLRVFDPKQRKWQETVQVKGVTTGTFDQLFSYRGELILLSFWQDDYAARIAYSHPSKLYHIDKRTGRARELHPEFSSPQARRSSAGIRVDDKFYLLGGQRQDSVWLSDMQCYHLNLRDPYYRGQTTRASTFDPRKSGVTH